MRRTTRKATAVLGLAVLAGCPAWSQQADTTHLLITMRWDSMADVDLHVIDPEGNEFHYASPTIPGVPGASIDDVLSGPGMELFEEANARTGTYRVYFNLYSGIGADVEGAVYTRQGRRALPAVSLQTEGQAVPVATVTVHADGAVDVADARDGPADRANLGLAGITYFLDATFENPLDEAVPVSGLSIHFRPDPREAMGCALAQISIYGVYVTHSRFDEAATVPTPVERHGAWAYHPDGCGEIFVEPEFVHALEANQTDTIRFAVEFPAGFRFLREITSIQLRYSQGGTGDIRSDVIQLTEQ